MLIGWTRESKDYKRGCDCPADFQHPHGRTGAKVDAFHLDHYARVCPNPPFSRMLAEVLYQQAFKTFRYTGNPSVSVTMLTSCPLQIWTERKYEYVEDPLAQRWMLRGTFAHEGILTHLNSPRYIVEQSMRLNIADGVDLYGRMDVYDTENNSIHDLKTQSLWAIKKKAEASTDKILEDPFVKANVFQVNAYRVMWGETIGRVAEEGWLHYWDGDLKEVVVPVPLVPLERMDEILRKDALKLHEALSQEDPKGIVPKDYSGYRWNPRDNSPLTYRINAIMEESAA